MTVADFNKMSLKQKSTVAFYESEFIQIKEVKGKKYARYAFENFFIQVRYNPDTLGAYEATGFNDGVLLDRYSNSF